jgi:hypothetical protein
MRRREFIALLGGAAAAVARPKMVLAQTTGKMPKVAVLVVSNADDPESGPLVSALSKECGRRDGPRT